MAGVILVNGAIPLSVRLNLDLLVYCEVCRSLLDSQDALTLSEKALTSAKQDDRAILRSKLTDAQRSYARALSDFHCERTSLSLVLTGVLGAEHWEQIKKMLASQCRRDIPLENELFHALTRIDRYTATPPLAVECLDNSFIELFKNSIDALLNRYLINQSGHTMLEMSILIAVEDNKLAINITDNGGGFSDSYLEDFADYLQTKAYKFKRLSVEKEQHHLCYFGGEGRGIPILCALILDGELLDSPGVSRKCYQVPMGDTAIHLTNNSSIHGAQIRLVSPLSPFVASLDEFGSALVSPQEKTSSSSAVGVSGFFSLSAPPQRKRKASTALIDDCVASCVEETAFMGKI